MNTIKIRKGSTQMVAHAGLGGMEMANTNAGFIAAGNRSYYGIETDVHITRDKHVVVVHDDNMLRVSGVDMVVEESTLEELQKLTLYDEPFFYEMEKYGVEVQKGIRRSDLHTPSLREYIHICKKYGKEAVLELKNRMDPEDVALIVTQVQAMGYLEHVTFISFHWDNLTDIRRLVPEQKVQYLTDMETEFSDEFVDRVAQHGFDLDIHVFTTTQELIERLHAKGIRVNVWTVDGPELAEKIAGWGADYITSNILE